MTADHTRPGGDASEFLLPTLPPLAPLEERVWVPNEVLAACSSVLAGVRRPRRRSSGSGSAVASIGVTSSEHGEGRTTVAHGLAVAQRNEYGRKTVLLDFGGDGDDSTGGLGLNAVLDGEVRVLDAVALGSASPRCSEGDRVVRRGFHAGQPLSSGLRPLPTS